jgi:hypothetical protein
VPSGQGLIGCGHETNRREREKKTQETEVRGGVRKKMVRMRKDFEDDERVDLKKKETPAALHVII